MKKNIILMAAALVAFAACEKPVPYEPGAQMDVNGPNVYFSNYYNTTSVVLSADATEFEVAVLRSDKSGALSVPLKASCGYDGMFEFPATVEFADGVDSVGVVVKITENFEMFKSYDVLLSIPEEFTHAYAPQSAVPLLNMSVLQEDYVPYAKGTYYDLFFTGSGWPLNIEYSAILKNYRLSDVWAPLGTGSTTDLIFEWDGSEKVVMSADSYPTGVSYGSYGPVTVVTTENIFYGDLSEFLGAPIEGFCFDFKWTVSAGSFGTGYPQLYVISETL